MGGRMIENRDPYFYYENTFVFSRLLGASAGAIWRFLIILLAILAALLALCYSMGALHLKSTPANAVGFLEDSVLLGICTLLVSGTIGTLLVIRSAERLFVQLPEILELRTKTPASQKRMLDDIERLRNFVSIRTPSASRLYWLWICVAIVLVVVAQIMAPLLRLNAGARSWALLPYEFSEVFVVACLWAAFQYVVVFANIIWYIFSVIFLVFPWLARRANEGLIAVKPIAADGVGGLSSVGSLSFSTTLVASGFLLIVIPWTLLFQLDLVYLALIAGYGVGLLAIFIIPLWSIHNAMSLGKQENLRRLAWAFEQEYSKLSEHVLIATSGMANDGAEPLAKLASSAESLQRLFERAESMPTWPVSKFARYAGGFLGVYPIIAAIILVLQEGYLKEFLLLFR